MTESTADPFAEIRALGEQVARLEEALAESLNQQTASAEVLKVINRSAFDLAPVLETLIENATMLCHAEQGFIFRRDGDAYVLAVAHKASPAVVEYIERNPIRLDSGSLVGRTALECRPVHIHDALADAQFKWLSAQKLGGYRTMLGVPMLRDGTPIGVIAMWRTEVRPFTDRQIDVVTTFADQAVIAIESVRLFMEIQDKNRQLQVANEKSDALLANILPQAIIEELKAKGLSEPRRHEEASILFTDFVGFTQAVSTIPPTRLVRELDDIFRGFDDIIAGCGLEKIKTIGDAYMATAGLPVAAEDHALRCVRAGTALIRFIEARNRTAAMKWELRVGVHSGSVVAGIVGKNKYAYDVWGDAVNIANRLESAGEAGKVNVSAYTFELVREHFDCEYRGRLAAKGKGEIDMYSVVGERAVA